MRGERGSPGRRCGWDEGREEGEQALEHALPSFWLLSLERVIGATSLHRVPFSISSATVARGVAPCGCCGDVSDE